MTNNPTKEQVEKIMEEAKKINPEDPIGFLLSISVSVCRTLGVEKKALINVIDVAYNTPLPG